MTENEEGFLSPHVNVELCSNCGLCLRKCPVESHEVEKRDEAPLCYAAYSLQETTRQGSSSGGVFSLLAEFVLSKGGVVYGAAFEEGCVVKHIRVDDLSELERLRKSKYVQSELGNCYQLVKEDLSQGLHVFFTGTPCQVAGLYSFLGEHPEGLLTADTVCMGVPSPSIYRQYLSEMEERYGAPVTAVDFRCKSPSWQGYQIRLTFANGKTYQCNRKMDDYMLAFSQRYILRPSCYECKFKSIHHEADITLGDFWGIEKVCSEMFDDRGTSMVLLHSPLGRDVFDAVSSQMKVKSVDSETITACNRYLVESVMQPANREEFWDCCARKSLKEAVSRYIRPSLLPRIWDAFRQSIHRAKVSFLNFLQSKSGGDK